MGKKSSPSNISGRIRVLVRCRPLLSIEREHTNSRIKIDEDENAVLIYDSPGSDSAKKYSFKKVLPPSADQEDLFEEIAPMIDHVLNGFHATVFAYGQTGSGKTYTMEGLDYSSTVNDFADLDDAYTRSTNTFTLDKNQNKIAPDLNTPVQQHGILPRSIQLFFDRVHSFNNRNDLDENVEFDHPPSQEKGLQFTLKCSFYQLYQEKITDLLNSSSTLPFSRKGSRREGLRLRWQPDDTFRISNLFLYECDSAETMRRAFFAGLKQKIMGSHRMNHQSSRSHCVFTIYVEARHSGTAEVAFRSEFSLVDLAGSEKLTLLAKNPSPQLIKESIDINGSLLALGKVITALSKVRKGSGGDSHIPYRDGKLTKLLKHALGGNSLTTMIACISPSDRYIEESISTLLYAGRAQSIENVPRVNEDPKTALIRKLKAEIRSLKEELAYYRELAKGNVGLIQASIPTESGVNENKGKLVDANVENTDKANSDQISMLADKLIDACAMLDRMMSVNAQLRDSFEAIKKDMETSEQREIQLNAENLALRERIEQLESIALHRDFVETQNSSHHQKNSNEKPENEFSQSEDDDDEDDDDKDSDSDSDNNNDDDNNNNNGDRHVHESAAINGDEWNGEKDPASKKAKSNVKDLAEYDRNKNASPLLDDSGGSLSQTYGRGTPQENQSPRGMDRERLHLHVNSLHYPKKVEDNALDFKNLPMDSSKTREKGSSRARRRPASPSLQSKEKRHGKGRNKKHDTDSGRERKKRKLVKRLNEYAKRYREPSVNTDSYASYYGKAQQQVPVNSQVRSMIEEMDKTLKKLPKDISDLVPISLTEPTCFGTLAFGGTDEQLEEYEKKREQREDKRQALLRRQRELYEQVRKDMKEFEEEIETEKPVISQAPVMPTENSYAPSSLALSGSYRAAMSGHNYLNNSIPRVHSSEKPRTETEKRTRTSASSHSKNSTAPVPSASSDFLESFHRHPNLYSSRTDSAQPSLLSAYNIDREKRDNNFDRFLKLLNKGKRSQPGCFEK